MAEFGKSYPDESTFRQRETNYIKNYMLIRHQSGSSLMKLNHLADWFDEEYDEILGLEHDYNKEDFEIPNYPKTDDLVPINWNELGAVTPVRDRSKWISPETGAKMYCASSYAVATAELLEGFHFRNSKKLVPRSV